MKYVLLFILLLPDLSYAQSNLSGLGPYLIGKTTPHSLKQTDFREQDQSYIKGTLTLPCTHIRTFTSARLDVAGMPVTNLSLAFYDDTLFSISCDYPDELKNVFTLKYGKGIPTPNHRFLFCTSGSDKTMVMWGETWENSDILAAAVHYKGYSIDCQPNEASKLLISSERLSALASDCDVLNTNQAIEEFMRALNDQQPPGRQHRGQPKTRK